jgi:protein SCO1/2
MTKWLRTIAACLAVGCLGAAVLWETTDGGRALTTEGSRRLAALEAPTLVPDVVLTDRHNQPVSLRRHDGSITLLEFIYTTCPVLCQSAGAAFLRLQELLQAADLKTDVQLLSVTFDLDRDGPAELEVYEQRHQADGRQWRIVRPLPRDLEPLLQAFGVLVLRDPIFGFEHNAAIHMVSDGRLVGIFDLEDIEGVVKRLEAVRQGRT